MSRASLPTTDCDFELLVAWQDGDREAGERLMSRYYDRVLRFFELRAGFIADDLTQQTFLACVNAKESVREASTFKAFLFAIARRQLIEARRRSGRRDAVIHRLVGWEGFSTSVSARVARRQEQQIVLSAMAQLPDELLIAVQLYYWEGMETKEIASVLDIVPSTLTSRLARARELLREEIAQITPRPELRDSILGELDAWARSLASIPLAGEPARRSSS